MDLIKIAKSAFGAAATGFSVVAAYEQFVESVFEPAKAGVIAAVLAVIFAVKTAVVERLEATNFPGN